MDFHLRFLIFISGLISVGHQYVHAIQLSVQLWKKMTSVNKTEEFLERFIRKANDSSLLDQDEYDKQMESILFTMQGSLKKSGLDVAASVMAAEDGCAPRMTSVRIPSHSDPYVLYWPSCTQVPQCGGCCGHESLECQPKRKKDHSVLVMRARHPEPGAEVFMFEGMDTIVLDEHLECECRCRVQSTHCNPLIHTYDEDSCSCRCNNEHEAVRCAANQHWENMQCACVCNEKPSCAHDEVFNNSTCRCDDIPTPKPKVPANPCTDIRCRQGYVPRQFGSFCRCEFNMHQVMPASGRGRDTVAAGIPILPHYLPASSSQQHRVNRFPSRRV